MPAARHTVGTPAVVPDLRARGLLRFFTHAARPGACSFDRAPDRAVLRARRELALVLCPRELCLRSPPATSARRIRWLKLPTSTVHTRDCPMIKSPRLSRAAPTERWTRERR